MRRFIQVMTVCAAAVAAGVVAGTVIRQRSSGTPGRLSAVLASELAPTHPDYGKVMCGPESLSVALGRLGVSTLAGEVAARCKITPYGVALTDLERVANDLAPVRAEARRLRWHDLRALAGVAVLFVNGNHYVTADPREPAPRGKAGAVRVYDREVPARWYARDELEHIWSGEALVVTKNPPPAAAPAGPAVAWDACHLDRGVVTDTQTAHYTFTLRNEGGKELVVENLTTSCGCTEPKLTADKLAPGASARLDVDVDLTGRQGFSLQSVTVTTNDPVNRVSYLRLACGIPRKSLVSSQAIRLEDLPQGGSLRRELVVADPSSDGARIRDARFQLRQAPGKAGGVSCDVSWERIGDNAKAVGDRIGYSTLPGDYLLRLAFRADGACAGGLFEGDVVVDLESGGEVTRRKVDVRGTVVQDVNAVPQIALITLGPDPGAVGRAAVQLRSRAGRKVAVVRAQADGAVDLDVEPAGVSEAGAARYVVAARMPELAAGAAPFRGGVNFELEGGTVVSVPVTVFRPSHGGH